MLSCLLAAQWRRGVCVLALLLAVSLQAQPPRMELFYSAEVKATDAKRIHFTLEVRHPAAEELVFEIPFWAPGAYRPITAGVMGGKPAIECMGDFRAESGTGAALPLERDERRIKVRCNGAESVRFHYVNNEPGASPNNRSFLAASSGLIDGPRSWAFLHGALAQPAVVRFILPPEWQVACGLESTPDPFVFHADDYDRLADCPVAIGRMECRTQLVRGVPHRIAAVTGGRESGTDWAALEDAVRRIVECSVDIFGDIPYPHYTFIYTPGGGGLEHLSSTTIGTANPARITVAGTRGVTAHEYFHTFNVKRMRPFALGPFDYSQPVPVDDLWICEGLTSYYANMLLWRGGLVGDSEFCSMYRSALGSFEGNPAHLEVSPQVSSRGVWTGDGRISYYLQGEVLGLALDLLIRDSSNNTASLDTAMRQMYRTYGGMYRHGKAEAGFQSADFPRVIRESTGVNVDQFFAAHIRRAEPVDWARYLSAAGFVMETQQTQRPAFMAMRSWARGPEAAVLPLGEGQPLTRFGLKEGDEITAVGETVVGNVRDALRALGSIAVGTTIKLKVKRGNSEVVLEHPSPAAGALFLLRCVDAEGGVHIAGAPQIHAFSDKAFQGEAMLRSVNGVAVRHAAHAQQLLAGVDVDAPTQLGVEQAGVTSTIVVKNELLQASSVKKFDINAAAPARAGLLREGLKNGHTRPVPPR